MNEFMNKNDIGPKDYSQIETIKSFFQSAFESYGYQKISLSTIEYSELFIKKLGDRIKSEMFVFKDQNGDEVCLRPEITSPCIRYYLAHHQNDELPLKLSYSEKIFRNQYKKGSELKESTHIGAEVIGVKSIYSDAENILLALDCIEKLGITNYRITLGNVGILTNLVKHLDVDLGFRNYFLENIRRKDGNKKLLYEKIKDRFLTIEPESDNQDLMRILTKLTYEEEKTLLTKLLHFIHPHFSEELDNAEEIVEGLLDKIKREVQHKSIQQVIDFSEKLQEISGTPKKAIEESISLLKDSQIDLAYVYDLKKVTEFLVENGISEDKIIIDFGLGRNFQYYTGTVFEIDYKEESQGENKQICGGGRYDDLIENIGSTKPLSGCGFAFNLESIYNILYPNHVPYQVRKDIINIYFLLEDKDNLSQIFPIIRQLRNTGYSVFMDVGQESYIKKLTSIKNEKLSQFIIYKENNQDKFIVVDCKNNQEQKLFINDILNSFPKKSTDVKQK